MGAPGRTSFRTDRLILLALASPLAGCGASAKAGASSAADLTARKIEAPDRVTLQMACTPTGPELCFNATDDNCNGVIDEGCGVGTGVLQFTIAWNEQAADVDLSVTDPAGNAVGSQHRASPTGLRLDRDCPGAPSSSESCGGQNTENVFFEGSEPPRGRYTVEIHLADAHGAPTPVLVRFGARIGARTFAADLSLAPGDTGGKKTFKFDL
jgi:tRNA (guanosine-2'-O-)-methyltransferase